MFLLAALAQAPQTSQAVSFEEARIGINSMMYPVLCLTTFMVTSMYAGFIRPDTKYLCATLTAAYILLPMSINYKYRSEILASGLIQFGNFFVANKRMHEQRLHCRESAKPQ